ncbi:MAG: ATP-binding cassette domain-containing protein [Spirosomataceae bacterium]
MIKIETDTIGKKYKNEWIFRDLTTTFEIGKPVAIVGPNGSGKSTLAQVLAGSSPATEGKLVWWKSKDEKLEEDQIFKQIAFVSPYLELVEEFTLSELLDFHARFKNFRLGFCKKTFLERVYLEKHVNKEVKYFSSGMKQRLKLALALFFDSKVLFLDEPTANLDKEGASWYLKEIQEVISNKIILISSNEPEEYVFTENILDIRSYKKKKVH